jgi:hypothetical protein
VHTGFWWKNLREREHLKDDDIDVRTILQSIFKKQNRAMDWIDLALDRDRWRILVNTAINLRVSYNVGNLLTS